MCTTLATWLSLQTLELLLLALVLVLALVQMLLLLLALALVLLLVLVLSKVTVHSCSLLSVRYVLHLPAINDSCSKVL